jgi:hypothetical protein
MTQSKHTPGPWRYQESSDAYTHIVRAGENYFICQLPQDTSGKAEANARLIAAAPDLLAALQAFFDSGKDVVKAGGCAPTRWDFRELQDAWQAARDLIAKATA